MSILDAVLSTPHPYLNKICDVVFRFVHHCVTHECNGDTVQNADVVDSHSSHLSLLSKVMFMKAMVCFPGSVYRSKKIVKELVTHAIRHFTAIVQQTLLCVGNETAVHSNEDVSLQFEILCTVLSQYGVLLTQQHRSAIQMLINRSLQALSKGVLIGGLPNVRTVDRKAPSRTAHSACEAVRLNGIYQAHVIRLATLDIMVPPSNSSSGSGSGTGTGNTAHTSSHTISMLRYVCNMCKAAGVGIFDSNKWSVTGSSPTMNTSYRMLSVQIETTELQLDSLLHPVIIPLPYPSVNYQTQECLDTILSRDPTKTNPSGVMDSSDGSMEIDAGVLNLLHPKADMKVKAEVATDLETVINPTKTETPAAVEDNIDSTPSPTHTSKIDASTTPDVTVDHLSTAASVTEMEHNTNNDDEQGSDSDLDDLPDIVL